MILLLDNFDSFTYNLYDYLFQSGAEVTILRNNESLENIKKKDFTGIVLSPGPGTPIKSGNLMEVVDYYHNKLPILGICLGHQAIGTYFGASLEKGSRPMHGKISEIDIEDDLLFRNLPKKINVTRYHSLILNNITSKLEVIAKTELNEIMAIKHNELPLRGIQFHPEAIMTPEGKQILSNWLTYYKLNK
ncbi:MAG TPA: aminodeoxychorismate/anthranilate synthase component II [Cytophagales bacterium]|nr:aminodeoxychorismate/anthranilate synthase component II [Cytophagales bacterium]